MSCLLLIARVFALPLTILLCDRLHFLNLRGNYWDVLWIALLLGFVNIIVRPLVMVIIMLVSLPFLLILRLPRLLMQVLGSFGLMFVTNVIMLWLVCKLLGVPLMSPWLAWLATIGGGALVMLLFWLWSWPKRRDMAQRLEASDAAKGH